MRYGLIFNILGLISRYISLIFLIPVVISLLLKEHNQYMPFLVSAIISLILGYLFSINKTDKKEIDNIKKSESLATVFFAWVFFGLIASIPYLFYGLNFTNACFEAFSGITATGATIIQDFSIYSKTLFFYRTMTQWFGGMGIVVLFIAVLPKIAVAGRQMFYAEAPMPTEDKVTPRVRYTAGWFWGIYLALTVAEIIILKFLGLNLYDSTVTSLATIATGGFSPKASICDFHNVNMSICVFVFMFVSAMNYILIYRVLRNKDILSVFKSEEFKNYIGIIVFLSILLCSSLFLNSHYEIIKAISNSFFQIVSTVTTTGFIMDDYGKWDITSKVILFSAFFIGGCATSTSGGIKIIRWVFILKYLRRELNKIIHPQAIYPIKLEGRLLNNDIISQMITFVIFYIVIFSFGAFLIVLLEHNTTVALSASIGAISNIGAGFGKIGSLACYAALTCATKWIVIGLMLVGRLEIIPFLAILNRDLWKN